MARTYLKVPYAQKDHAKQLGARWDASARSWYVPHGVDITPFQRWLPVKNSQPIVKKQVSSAASTKPRLTIELVPQTCWYSNVRSEVSKADWEKLKHSTFQQANYRCQVCGGRGSKHPVECHEIWHYDDRQHIQKLAGLIALCPACHECKHMGFANVRGRGEIGKAHLAKVNGWTMEQTMLYVQECFRVWQERSQHEWKLDITYLDQVGIKGNSSAL